MFSHLLQTQLLIGSFLFLHTAWAEAQESSAVEKFAKVHAEWKNLDQQINAVVTEFGKANDERKQELRNEFAKLQVKAKAMRPRLRTAALQAYMRSPNKSQDVANVLIGMAASEIYQDDISSAAVITEMMLKHQSPEKKLDDLAGVVAFVQHDFKTAKKHFLRAKENDSLGSENKFYLTKIDNYPKLWAAEKAKRSAEAKADDLPRVKFATTKGDIVFELFENEAPNTVGNFVHLVESKFYDGLTFHRERLPPCGDEIRFRVGASCEKDWAELPPKCVTGTLPILEAQIAFLLQTVSTVDEIAGRVHQSATAASSLPSSPAVVSRFHSFASLRIRNCPSFRTQET